MSETTSQFIGRSDAKEFAETIGSETVRLQAEWRLARREYDDALADGNASSADYWNAYSLQLKLIIGGSYGTEDCVVCAEMGPLKCDNHA